MGFTVVRYKDGENSRWGIVEGDQVTPIPGDYNSLASFLDEGRDIAKEILITSNIESVFIGSLEVLGPVTQPAQVVCQGLNYASHRTETGSTGGPEFNMLFVKADSSLTGPYNDIIRPSNVNLLDYEIELGLVIGKPIIEPIQVSESNLHEYVAGLVITNDISGRDVQVPQDQYFKGKSYRTFCPTGPYLYLLDKEDVEQLFNLELKLWVNDELRQSGNTNQLIYKPAETLMELSELMDLSPGDVLLTGTPGGVAIKLNNDITQRLMLASEGKTEIFRESQLGNTQYLKDGDVIRSQIKSPDGRINLGIQNNRVTNTI